MQNRFSWFLSMSLVFLAVLLFSNIMFPPNPAPQNAGNAVIKQDDAAKNPNLDPDKQESDPSKSGEDADSVNAKSNDDLKPADGQTGEKTDKPPPGPSELKPPTLPKYFSLGSLESDGKERFLVTFSDHGGSIVRIELNARDKYGNYRYRDLEHFGSYIGKLQLQKHDGRVIVGAVGAGTPAAKAGLQPGDEIVSIKTDLIDFQPIVSPDDFEVLMAKIKPDETISVSILRKKGETAESHSIDIQSTDQPLELLRPEHDVLGPGIKSPASFLTTLRKPEIHSIYWAEIDSAMKAGEWEVQESQVDGNPAVDFVYEVSKETAEKLDLKGPFQIVKRYWLPRLDDSNRFDFSSRTFHINLQVIVKNLCDDEQSLALQIDGPTGTPTEGWWYQNKIHGRQSAFGYLAGARDVAGQTAANSYAFWGGPEIVTNSQKTNATFQYIVNPTLAINDPKISALKYVGVDTQYFNVSLIPIAADDNTNSEYHCYSAMAGVASPTVPKEAKLRRLVDCTFYLFEKVDLKPQAVNSQRYEIFAGPKETDLLTTYGLEDNRTFGWFAGFSKFLCWLLTFLYKATFSLSYGLAIILLTVIVRVLMIPLSRKAALNAQMMQLLAPEMKVIADKYKDDMEKRSQAQRELFQRHKYNPFGGCLLIFLQLPIFIGLYRGLSVDIALRDQAFLPGMRWCSNLAAPDALFYWKEWMPAFLAGESGWLGPWFNVLPLVTIALFLVQQKLFTPPPTDEQQAMMHRMMSFMMVIMGVMFFKVPSGLCIYFITSSLWGIAERQLLPKPKLSDAKVRSVQGSLSASPDETKPGGSSNGIFGKIKNAIEKRTTGSQAAPDPDELRRQDRERKKKLKDRGY